MGAGPDLGSLVPQPLDDLVARQCEDCAKPIKAGYVHQVGKVGESIHVIIVCRECNVKRRNAH